MSDAAASPCDIDARIAALEAALAARDSVIEALRIQLAQFRRMTFGASSEKLALQIEQLELALEELEGEAELADSRASAPRRSGRCRRICRARNAGSNRRQAAAPAPIVAAPCAP